MKKILKLLIVFYQKFISPSLKQLLGISDSCGSCRFSPTCSEYARQSIEKKGVLKGVYFSIVRVLKCQPFYSKAI